MKKRWFFYLRKIVGRFFAGTFQSVKKGADGIEFAAFRDWQPSDIARSISYRQSLKKLHYVVRVNTIEKGMICLFIVDRSASIEFGPSGISKKEIQDRILNILAPAVAQNNNQVGFLVTSDRVERYLKPCFGEKFIAERLALISNYKPKSRLTDLNAVFRSVLKLNIPADLIFIVSDFYSPTDFADSLKILTKKHDVIPLILKDSFETTTFPKIRGGMIAFKDLETEDFFWGEAPHKISNVGLLKRLGLDYVLLKTSETEGDWIKKMMIVFQQRKKRRKIIK